MSKQPWPRDGLASRAFARFQTPAPVEIAKALIWVMRDRGLMSPDDLCGLRLEELEAVARKRKKNRSGYETFEEALDDAIASGWIETYEVSGETYYLPNYKRGPLRGGPMADAAVTEHG